jgi:hypothetical protein
VKKMTKEEVAEHERALNLLFYYLRIQEVWAEKNRLVIPVEKSRIKPGGDILRRFLRGSFSQKCKWRSIWNVRATPKVIYLDFFVGSSFSFLKKLYLAGHNIGTSKTIVDKVVNSDQEVAIILNCGNRACLF